MMAKTKQGVTMKEILFLALMILGIWGLLTMVAGCSMQVRSLDGDTYISGAMGLGVGDESNTVPNLMVYDVPVKPMQISSPLLTEVAKTLWVGSGGLLDWAFEWVEKAMVKP